jgi:hypothetical protein
MPFNKEMRDKLRNCEVIPASERLRQIEEGKKDAAKNSSDTRRGQESTHSKYLTHKLYW